MKKESKLDKLFMPIVIGCSLLALAGGILKSYDKSHPDKEIIRNELIGAPINVNLTNKAGMFSGSLYLSGVVKNKYGKIVSFGYPQTNLVCGTKMSQAYSLIQSEIEDGDNETVEFKTTYNPAYGRFRVYITANGETIEY